MAGHDAIPVVDFQEVWDSEDLSKCPQVLELHNAFTDMGVVFLKNSGIKMDLVNRTFETALQFFKLPLPVKRKYLLKVGENGTGMNGYVALEQESVDPQNPGDLKENYDLVDIETSCFPDDELPELRAVMVEVYKWGKTCALKILEVMAHALQLKDPLFFVKCHQAAGHKGSFSSFRLAYYPPLPSSMVIKPGQMRIGEHVDYGSITLLFQDPNGGLQVKKRDGSYVDVPYMKDVVLMNMGALLQRWTSDRYWAAPHRVLVPGEATRNRARQSVAVFIHPDHKELIECVDGTGKYPPVLVCDDLKKKMVNSYNP